MGGLCIVLMAVGPSEAATQGRHDSARPPVPTPTTSTPSSRPAGRPHTIPPDHSRRPSVTPPPTEPSQLHVVALGDSVTDGSNCGCVPFPQLYAAALRNFYRIPVEITNDGLAGATSADVLAGLNADWTAVRGADVVVVTVGANDFSGVSNDVLSTTCGGNDNLACTQGRLIELQRNLGKIVNKIEALHRGHPATLLLTGYWNVYEDGNVADADYSEAGLAASIALTRAVNREVKAAADHTKATYVDLFAPFKGADGNHDATPLLTDDGDHPNAAGHRAIAQALLAASLPGRLPRSR